MGIEQLLSKRHIPDRAYLQKLSSLDNLETAYYCSRLNTTILQRGRLSFYLILVPWMNSNSTRLACRRASSQLCNMFLLRLPKLRQMQCRWAERAHWVCFRCVGVLPQLVPNMIYSNHQANVAPVTYILNSLYFCEIQWFNDAKSNLQNIAMSASSSAHKPTEGFQFPWKSRNQ